jgi:hypothetical protein
LFGLSMSQDQSAIFRVHTGRQALPEAPAREAWLVVGRHVVTKALPYLLARVADPGILEESLSPVE